MATKTPPSRWPVNLPERIPQDEQQWQIQRKLHGLDNPEHIVNKLAVFDARGLSCDSHPELEIWQQVVLFAASIVDLHFGQDKAAFSRGVLGGRLTSVPQKRATTAVLRLIKSLDRLYPHLKHRAFELLVFLDVPISMLQRWPRRDFERLETFFPRDTKPPDEIEASVPLYIPFLVKLLRPMYPLEQICVALKTNTLGKCEFDKFWKSIQSSKGDKEVSMLDLVQPNYFSVTSPLRTIQHYATFHLSDELQKKAMEAGNRQRGYDPVPSGMSNEAQFYGFQWSSLHMDVVKLAIPLMVNLELLVKGEEGFTKSRAVCHKSGSIRTPDGTFRTIIPTTKNDEPRKVSLGGYMLGQNWVPWENHLGYVLNQGVCILPELGKDIGYVSMLSFNHPSH
ncbi:hypothetical protein EDB81DRAFT_808097 [Dactylonectria macrodidyma]|uniref:Uncharacterized protein n=1 Tax=Dactylonectria macrodidyma TaxID=307937 RepID=A0A9P9E3B3_9HYPO|nr:hypothetical protein EDB81DRAFT_808097 [Dactylonectria macrodidyma]